MHNLSINKQNQNNFQGFLNGFVDNRPCWTLWATLFFTKMSSLRWNKVVHFILRAPDTVLSSPARPSLSRLETVTRRTQNKVHHLVSPQRRHFREKQICSEGSAGSIIHESVEKTLKKLLLQCQKRDKQQKSYGQLDWTNPDQLSLPHSDFGDSYNATDNT